MKTSASALERVINCPGSESLPHAKSTSVYAQSGTVIHKYVEECATLGPEKALANVPQKYLERCRDIDIASLPIDPDRFQAEVAFAVDCSDGSARVLGRGIGRDYGDLRPFEIPGTTDICGVLDDAVYVADIKTGFEDVTPPASNPQLLHLGYAAAKVHGKDKAILDIIYVRESGIRYERGIVEGFGIDAFGLRLRETFIQVGAAQAAVARGDDPQLSEGGWCKYCPAFVHCPQKARLAVALGTGELIKVNAELTRGSAVRAYHKLLAAKAMLRKIENTIYVLAEQEPLDLGDGTLLGMVEKRGNEKLNGDTVWPVMADLHGREVADAAIRRTATKKDIRAALKQSNGKGSLAKKEEEVLDLVRKAGGSQRKMTRSIDIYPKDG